MRNGPGRAERGAGPGMRTERSEDAGAGAAQPITIAPKPAGWTASRRARVNPRTAPGGSRVGACGYRTGRWYARRYRSAGTTTSAVSTARPDA